MAMSHLEVRDYYDNRYIPGVHNYDSLVSLYEEKLWEDDLRDSPLLECGASDKKYWACVRSLGSANVEISVCRPSVESFGKAFVNEYGDKVKRRKVMSDQDRINKDAENEKRAIRRARQNIRFGVKRLDADRLLTLDTRAIISDRAEFGRLFYNWRRLVVARFPDFAYYGVLEYQDRGALHMHLAVKGKQPIKWMLRCWQVVLGADVDAINQWYSHGVKMGDKSLGAVNVTSPSKRWGGASESWKVDKLAGYMSKYIAKDFGQIAKGAKKYWSTPGIAKAKVLKFWLGADSFHDAITEACSWAEAQDINSMQLRVDFDIGNIWLCVSRPPALRNDVQEAPDIVSPIPF